MTDDIEIIKAALAKGPTPVWEIGMSWRELSREQSDIDEAWMIACQPHRLQRIVEMCEAYERALQEVTELAFVAFDLCAHCDKGFETMPCTCMDVSISDEFRKAEGLVNATLAKYAKRDDRAEKLDKIIAQLDGKELRNESGR